MIKLRYFLLLIFLVLGPVSPANAGGSHWRVSIDKAIDIEFAPEISMTILESKDTFLKGCTQIIVKVDKPDGLLSWINSLVSNRQEKTRASIISLNTKFTDQKVAFFGYVGGGLVRAPDNDCIFSAKYLEIDNSIEKGESVVVAYE